MTTTGDVSTTTQLPVYVERGGEISYSFLVAAKYIEKSRFTFGEILSVEGDGAYYWFYLKDFAASTAAQASRTRPWARSATA